MRPSALPLLLALFAGPALAQEPAETTPADGSGPADTPRAQLEERSQQQAEALARQLPTAQQQWLEAAGERFLALWQPANQPQPLGLLILLPEAGNSADWPQVIHSLRNGLPDHGWSTLSLSLPDAIPAPLPAALLPRTPDAEPATAADTAAADSPQPPADSPPADAATAAAGAAPDSPAPVAAPPVDPGERLFARLEAALAFAEQQDAGPVVLAGQGSSAYWAALFVQEQQPPAVQRLLLLQARQLAGQALPLADRVAALKLPVGDFFNSGQAAARTEARLRKQASQRLGREDYWQVGLADPTGTSADHEEQLLRRVRGWLGRH